MPQVPSTQEEAKAWVHEFYRLSDALDASKFKDIFAPDSNLTFANNPPMHGADIIAAAMGAQFATLEYMKHEWRYGDLVRNRIYHSSTISYILKGDNSHTVISIPGAANFTLVTNGPHVGKIESVEVFLDYTPVREKMAEMEAAAAPVEAK